MAMNMKGEVTLPGTAELVWEKLNDPEVLQAAIPGCQSLESSEENGFKAAAKVKIGPISATFRGAVTLSDLDPPWSYRIAGAGDGGVAGFAKGGARVVLSDTAEGCLLSYEVEANVGGKLAQLGARMLDGVAKKLADQFFENFAAVVSAGVE